MNKGNNVIEQKKLWLQGITWDSVVNVNRTLCQAQKLEPLVNAKTHSKARENWDQAGQKPMTLLEAVATCRNAFDQAPFTFNNGNTFAAIARGLVEDCLRNAPSVESQIIRTTVSHYVAGTIGRKELEQVLDQLAPVLSPATTPPAARPSESSNVAAPRFDARPVTST